MNVMFTVINRSRCLEHDVARIYQVLHWNFSIPVLRHALDIPIYLYNNIELFCNKYVCNKLSELIKILKRTEKT